MDYLKYSASHIWEEDPPQPIKETPKVILPPKRKRERIGQHLWSPKWPSLIRRRRKKLLRMTVPETVMLFTIRWCDLPCQPQWPIYVRGRWYFMDFYLPSLGVCVEIDGTSHRTTKARHYDSRRDEDLKDCGIVTLRLDNEVMDNRLQAYVLLKQGLEKCKMERRTLS